MTSGLVVENNAQQIYLWMSMALNFRQHFKFWFKDDGHNLIIYFYI